MLSKSQIINIKEEVEIAATAHLNAKDPDTALSHFMDEVTAVSNLELFSSRELLSADIREYYRILKKINYASWEDIYIDVINESVAIFTAKFSYGFTDINDKVTDLKGVWTALFILDKGLWKIRVRHESFKQI